MRVCVFRSVQETLHLNRLLALRPTSRSSHCSVLSASSLVVCCQPSSITTHRGRTPPSCSVDNPSSTSVKRAKPHQISQALSSTNTAFTVHDLSYCQVVASYPAAQPAAPMLVTQQGSQIVGPTSKSTDNCPRIPYGVTSISPVLLYSTVQHRITMATRGTQVTWRSAMIHTRSIDEQQTKKRRVACCG